MSLRILSQRAVSSGMRASVVRRPVVSRRLLQTAVTPNNTIKDFEDVDNQWAKHGLPTKNGRFVEPAPLEKEAPAKEEPKRRRRKLRPRKALITLSQNALCHLRQLSAQPNPKMIRIGVQNRGCSGLSYHLEYVTEPGQFDELVEQDGVKVLIDSKALFSIVGSEMDWIDDKLSSKFVFKNPNSKGTCGCGESFMV